MEQGCKDAKQTCFAPKQTCFTPKQINKAPPIVSIFSPKGQRLSLQRTLCAGFPPEARLAIDRITGGNGAYQEDEKVYKVVFPREAATIVQNWQLLSPHVGLNSWVAFAPAIVRRPANIRAGKRWTYVSSGVASLIHAATCLLAGLSARSPLRTACSKAGAGAIQIMVMRRSV